MSQQVLDSLSSALPQIPRDRPSDDEFYAFMARMELLLNPQAAGQLEQELANVQRDLGVVLS